MSEELLNSILRKLESIESNMATKQDVEAIQKKLDTIYEQVANNTEFQTKTTNDLNTHEHSLNVLHRNQFRIETEIEKLKNNQ